jgi:hypothetical protein
LVVASASARGIETCLAGRQLGLRPCWALGSAGAIKKFSTVNGVGELVILAENDNGTNRNAAEVCRENWKSHRVTIVTPPRGFKDMNSLLMGKEDVQDAFGVAVEH